MNGQSALKVQLVISYTQQLVAGGIDLNPWTKFLQINEEPIYPELLPMEIKELDHSYSTPINYGLRIYNESDIETIKINYKYLGISFVKAVKLDTWLQ